MSKAIYCSSCFKYNPVTYKKCYSCGCNRFSEWRNGEFVDVGERET